jgi:hypothetical protein
LPVESVTAKKVSFTTDEKTFILTESSEVAAAESLPEKDPVAIIFPLMEPFFFGKN